MSDSSMSSRRGFLGGAAALAGVVAAGGSAAGEVASQQGLKRFQVTIRRFDPQAGVGSGVDFVLPVDSPDEEHAIASTLANAASFSTKVSGGRPLPVAFLCTAITMRP